MPARRQAIVFANLDKAHAATMSREIGECLAAEGFAVAECSSLCFCDNPEMDGAELAVSLGGDGTVLATARYVSPFGVAIFPINLGNFGFITEFGRDDWREELTAFVRRPARTVDRLMLEVGVVREGARVFSSLALNDAVVSGSGISKLIRLRVDLERAALGQYRADGMIIATPTGSTAYSAAAGGPILSPEMEGIILNPICPFTLSHRPVVLPAGERIGIRVEQQQRTEVLLTVDGQITFPLREGDAIDIRRADRPARIAFSPRRNFYDVLRAKLNWSGGPDA